MGIRQGPGRWYVLGDQQASVAKVIDSSGATAAFWRRNAYGVVLASGGTPINWWGFHGTYLDATGLNKMGARYYDSATGAFTQIEPVKDTSALRGIIDYTYAGADPINQMDPGGTFSLPAWNPFAEPYRRIKETTYRYTKPIGDEIASAEKRCAYGGRVGLELDNHRTGSSIYWCYDRCRPRRLHGLPVGNALGAR